MSWRCAPSAAHLHILSPRSIMRLSAVLVLVCFCFLAVLVYNAIRQEMVFRKARNQLQIITQEVEKTESKKYQAKQNIQELNNLLSSAADKANDLSMSTPDMVKAGKEILQNLQACNTHKAEIMKSKNVADENLQKLKANQEKEKKVAGEEIGLLKEQISERYKLCQFVDMKNEEARKLCENAMAPK